MMQIVLSIVMVLLLMGILISIAVLALSDTKSDAGLGLAGLVVSLLFLGVTSHHITMIKRCLRYEDMLISTGKYMRVYSINGEEPVIEVATPSAEVILSLPMEMPK